jgi:hypothetical protein
LLGIEQRLALVWIYIDIVHWIRTIVKSLATTKTSIETLIEVTTSFVNYDNSLRIIIESMIAMAAMMPVMAVMSMMPMMAMLVDIDLDNIDMWVHNFIYLL